MFSWLRRREELDQLLKLGIDPYPYEFARNAFSKEIIETSRTIRQKGKLRSQAGFMSIRRMGKASFCHVQDTHEGYRSI